MKHRWIEVILLFGLLPLIPLTGYLPRPWFLYLYVLCVPAAIWLKNNGNHSWRELWLPRDRTSKHSNVKAVLLRGAIAAIFLSVGTLFVRPEHVFHFPRSQPTLWFGFMILYPVFAVPPQEFLFRSFLMKRYSSLLPRPWILLFSGLAFGWAHLAYGNLTAVLLSSVGGSLIADTYERTGSLRLACLEHTLYGIIVFTVGLGDLFYSGWVAGVSLG